MAGYENSTKTKSRSTRNNSKRWPPYEHDAVDIFGEEDPLHVIRAPSLQPLQFDEDGMDRLPKFLREPPRGLRKQYLPLSLKRALYALTEWSEGPETPQIQKITPMFPSLDRLPYQIRSRLRAKIHPNATLAIIFLLWALLVFFDVSELMPPPILEGYGSAKHISCMQQAW